MGPRTRSAANSPVKKKTTESSMSTAKESKIVTQEPRQILLLPTDSSAEARLLLLPHPQDGSKKRFLFCPVKGLFEFTKVATQPPEYRSTLIANEGDDDSLGHASGSSEETDRGYINKDASLLVATPFDTLFLLLPLLPSSLKSTGKILFQPLDDLLDSHTSMDRHVRHLMLSGRHILEERLASFCDTIDAGDEKMFRINEDKVLKIMVEKIQKIVEQGLPASLEEKFVTRALEAPVLSVKRQDISINTTESLVTPRDDPATPSESFDSQSTTTSTAPSAVFSEVSIASSVTTIQPEAATEPVSDHLKHLQRLVVALDFIMASYISTSLSPQIREKIMTGGLLADFKPLNEHLSTLAKLKAEAMASRSLTDFSRKRGNADDDEGAEERAEKKRRLEEDEKRKKAGESRGVRDLKKVNITGMKKVSDFFSKKAPTTKAKS
jgi:hypothetical protein